MKRWALRFCLVAALAVVGTGAYGWYEIHREYKGYANELVVDIPPGMGAREILGLLEDEGVIENRYLATLWLYFSGYRGNLQAGEYVFAEPLDVGDVLRRLAEGRVRLYSITIPEGFRIDQVADRWEQEGFGKREEFLEAAEDALPLVREFSPDASTTEGYLFPETYSFPRGTPAGKAVQSMIEAFRDTIGRLEREVPRTEWPLDLNGTLILASLIESEVAVSDERVLVSSVFLNRLERKMPLECDPTVVYALMREGLYRGRLLRVDLDFDSPYNTYRYPSLPPGAISNPGYLSLFAAIQPAETAYLFFVRREGGRHTFSATLAEHNRAVAEYRRMSNQAGSLSK